MFTLPHAQSRSGKSAAFCDGVPRRGFLCAGTLTYGGLTLANILRLRSAALASQTTLPTRQDTSVIFVELAGGPTQFETYDPKPKAPREYRGDFGITHTNLAGTHFCELMPKQSRMLDKLAIVRSIQHGHNSHDPSSHLSQTGYYKSGPKGGPNQLPCFGSIVAKLRGPNHAALPAYVAIPRIMRNGQSAFLGQAYNPFETISDPNDPKFHVRNLTLARDLNIRRLENRRSLLSALDARQQLQDLQESASAVDDFSRQAFDLVHGSRAKKAFDLSQESNALRDRYGRNTVGQSMLLARRLVESGVTCVTVRCTGWDDHNNIAPNLRKRAPVYDQAIATLIEELFDRGLQEKVLVIAMGEFGRTPRINKNAGRDHWGALMSVLLAGGGLKTGIVGASNSKGEVPVECQYRPENVLAMMYRHLGINPETTFDDLSGRPRHVLEQRELIQELL